MSFVLMFKCLVFDDGRERRNSDWFTTVQGVGRSGHEIKEKITYFCIFYWNLAASVSCEIF